MLHSKFDLSLFEENIYTEFQPPYGKTLQVKALKTDAQGAGSLKKTLGVAKIKTCDYISINENKIFMIEITDLKRQEDDLEGLLMALKQKLCPVAHGEYDDMVAIKAITCKEMNTVIEENRLS